jgi:hypothetical protein
MFAGLQRRFFAILLVSGVYGMPADTAYADDCLAAPTSSASGESQWLNGVYPGNVLKCWYLRAIGQPEQKIVVQDSSTAVPARRSQLVHRPPAPTPKAAPPKTQIPLARDYGTRPSPGVAASTIKTHPSTLEQSAEENAHSPSIQPAMVPNTDAPEIDEQRLQRGSQFASCGLCRYPKFHQSRQGLLQSRKTKASRWPAPRLTLRRRDRPRVAPQAA